MDDQAPVDPCARCWNGMGNGMVTHSLVVRLVAGGIHDLVERDLVAGKSRVLTRGPGLAEVEAVACGRFRDQWCYMLGREEHHLCIHRRLAEVEGAASGKAGGCVLDDGDGAALG